MIPSLWPMLALKNDFSLFLFLLSSSPRAMLESLFYEIVNFLYQLAFYKSPLVALAHYLFPSRSNFLFLVLHVAL